jgi:S-adenosylmethionine hydrolase
MKGPIVFLTDYGLADEFVGICHVVMARIAPDAMVIDLTHSIPRQDVMSGALTLARAVAYVPPDSIYLAVVDPGVGSARKPVAIRSSSGALMVGPDNGLLSLAWDGMGGAAAAVEITADEAMLHPVSKTFHGRDVFAPAAAHLAAGWPLGRLGPEVDPGTLRQLEIARPMVTLGAVGARVIGIDGFGNVQLNARPSDLESAGLGQVLSLSGRNLSRASIFEDVPRGRLGSIVDSQGHISLFVNRGSAAEMLGLSVGSAVVLE